MKKGIVIRDHTASNPDPIKVVSGDIVKVGKRDKGWPGWIWCTTQDDKASWVPENILNIKNEKATVIQDYDATEMTVVVGEKLVLFQEESGWVWCKNQTGKQGWVPIENIKKI